MLEITNPINGERLQVAENDFEGQITWQEAIDACKNLENGWRLPTVSELEIMYTVLYCNGSGNFKCSGYWSSEINGDKYAWYFRYIGGGSTYVSKNRTIYARANRTFKPEY